MGWTKVAEVVVTADTSEIVVDFPIKAGYNYLILGEGKTEGRYPNMVILQLLQDTTILREVNWDTDTEWTPLPYYILGLLNIGEGEGGNYYLMSSMSHWIFDLPDCWGDGKTELGDCGFPPTSALKLKFAFTNGTIKSGFKILIFEKRIE
jgi:hypothetical protein